MSLDTIALIAGLYGLGEIVLLYLLFSKKGGHSAAQLTALIVPTTMVGCYFLATEVHWSMGLTAALALTYIKVAGFRKLIAHAAKSHSS